MLWLRNPAHFSLTATFKSVTKKATLRSLFLFSFYALIDNQFARTTSSAEKKNAASIAAFSTESEP